MPLRPAEPMALSCDGVRDRAVQLSRRRADAHEKAPHGAGFSIDACENFGIADPRVATFEHAVRKIGGERGRADPFWRGKLQVGHGSPGEDLDVALGRLPECRNRTFVEHGSAP